MRAIDRVGYDELKAGCLTDKVCTWLCDNDMC